MQPVQPSSKPRILLCLTGSVASIKATLLVQELQTFGEVRVVATEKSLYFFNPQTLDTMLFRDSNEWPNTTSTASTTTTVQSAQYKRGDDILHIQLRDWCDVLLIAPLSANTLAKISTGLCDNLLTSIVRALPRQKRIVVAPAMNTQMYLNPFTQLHLQLLKSVYPNLIVIEPITKLLACGDYGKGAMPEPSSISNVVREQCTTSLNTGIHSIPQNRFNSADECKIEVEICVDSLNSALSALQGGAHRLEVCSALALGGLTSSIGLLKAVRGAINVPISVLLRPRPGDFHYTAEEWEIVLEDVCEMQKILRNGDCFVIGALLPSGELDLFKLNQAIQACKPFEVVMHRAFDLCSNPIKALKQLHSLGIKRILSSGQAKSALQGVELLKKMNSYAKKLSSNGKEIKVVAAYGIRSHNVNQLLKETGMSAIHASSSCTVQSKMQFRNSNAQMGQIGEEYEWIECNQKEVEKILKEVQDFERSQSLSSDCNKLSLNGDESDEHELFSMTEFTHTSKRCSVVAFDKKSQTFPFLSMKGKLLRNMGVFIGGKQRLLPHELVWAQTRGAVVVQLDGTGEQYYLLQKIARDKLYILDNVMKVFTHLRDKLNEEVVWTLPQFMNAKMREAVTRSNNSADPAHSDEPIASVNTEFEHLNIQNSILPFEVLLVWHHGGLDFKRSSPQRPEYAVIVHNPTDKSEDEFLNEHFLPTNQHSASNHFKSYCEKNDSLCSLIGVDFKLAFVNDETVNILAINQWNHKS